MCICRYWTVALTGISVSGQGIGIAATQVVVDSGTSAILLGKEDAAAIHMVNLPSSPPDPLKYLPTSQP